MSVVDAVLSAGVNRASVTITPFTVSLGTLLQEGTIPGASDMGVSCRRGCLMTTPQLCARGLAAGERG
jgi:hypothetical protein